MFALAKLRDSSFRRGDRCWHRRLAPLGPKRAARGVTGLRSETGPRKANRAEKSVCRARLHVVSVSAAILLSLLASAGNAQEQVAHSSNRISSLPDAPVPKLADSMQSSETTSDAQRADQWPQPQSGSNRVLPLPAAKLGPLSFGEKFKMYYHQTFGPPAVVFPAFAAGMSMAKPKDHYPRDWKQGADAFGRLYGDAAAMATSRRTARFVTGAALHEDPRYMPSDSKNPLVRTLHAVAFTFVDRTDGGRRTIAFSNFAGAAGGGFVGIGYLPHGYNDLTHAEQRMAVQFGGIAIENIAAEFQPQLGPIVHKLRIDKILPEWWVREHK